jgi:hypothetical protein
VALVALVDAGASCLFVWGPIRWSCWSTHQPRDDHHPVLRTVPTMCR